MDAIWEMMKYIIPSLVTGGIVFLVIRQFMERDARRLGFELRKKNQEIFTPIRIQSYERLIIFLERISPGSIIMRVHKQGMSSRKLQEDLIKTIRAEFEHNLSQQIFVSNMGWELTKKAKEDMIRLINTAAGKINDNATGLAFSALLLEMSSKIEQLPTQTAIDYLKKEIRQSF